MYRSMLFALVLALALPVLLLLFAHFRLLYSRSLAIIHRVFFSLLKTIQTFQVYEFIGIVVQQPNNVFVHSFIQFFLLLLLLLPILTLSVAFSTVARKSIYFCKWSNDLMTHINPNENKYTWLSTKLYIGSIQLSNLLAHAHTLSLFLFRCLDLSLFLSPIPTVAREARAPFLSVFLFSLIHSFLSAFLHSSNRSIAVSIWMVFSLILLLFL